MQSLKIVSLTNVSISFANEAPVLQNLNLEISQGETLSILGPGGSGKSTLLKVILGILKPQSGLVTVFGEAVHSLEKSKRSPFLKRIGMAFQQGALFDFMTVRENILFAIENMTLLKKEEQEQKMIDFLTAVNLRHAANKYPSELSGGMRRRVGLVRALITNPTLALLDEPTAGLDPVTTTIVIDMIHKIGENIGTTLVSVTSNLDVAFRFAKKVALLKDGKIIGTGNQTELLTHPDPWIKKFLTIRGQKF